MSGSTQGDPPSSATTPGREFHFAGVQLWDTTVERAVRELARAARERRPLGVHLCNAFTLSLAARDPAYVRTLNRRSYNLVDGVPVSWYFSLTHGRTTSRPVRGPTLMRRVLSDVAADHFLLGGTPEVVSTLETSALSKAPGCRIVGTFSPPFGEIDDALIATMRDQIVSSGASIVWVGLGTPKQDDVIARLVDNAPAVYVGVGAAFDFLSGAKAEAPRWLQGSGWEWLYRLFREPRRLWRRYLVGNTVFVVKALQEGRRELTRR